MDGWVMQAPSSSYSDCCKSLNSKWDMRSVMSHPIETTSWIESDRWSCFTAGCQPRPVWSGPRPGLAQTFIVRFREKKKYFLSQLPGIRTVSPSFPSFTILGLQCSTNPSILMTFIFLDCCEIWSRQPHSPQDGLKWPWWSLKECSVNLVWHLCNCGTKIDATQPKIFFRLLECF